MQTEHRYDIWQLLESHWEPACFPTTLLAKAQETPSRVKLASAATSTVKSRSDTWARTCLASTTTCSVQVSCSRTNKPMNSTISWSRRHSLRESSRTWLRSHGLWAKIVGTLLPSRVVIVTTSTMLLKVMQNQGYTWLRNLFSSSLHWMIPSLGLMWFRLTTATTRSWSGWRRLAPTAAMWRESTYRKIFGLQNHLWTF